MTGLQFVEAFSSSRSVFPEKGKDSLVKLLWRIDCIEDTLVSVNQGTVVHFWYEVSGTIGIVTGHIA